MFPQYILGVFAGLVPVLILWQWQVLENGPSANRGEPVRVRVRR